jgi:hypothetical protein
MGAPGHRTWLGHAAGRGAYHRFGAHLHDAIVMDRRAEGRVCANSDCVKSVATPSRLLIRRQGMEALTLERIADATACACRRRL